MNSGQADFVRANTKIVRPGFTPEIALHLATEVTPLWHATADSLFESGVEPPFWAFAWPGGLALARYILDNPDLCEGRAVLDIASGSGLVAIAAAMAGAASVTANDIDPVSISAVALNAKLNGVDLSLSGDDLTAHPHDDRWKIILAGDVYYDREMAALVTPWLTACAAAGALVMVGDPGRTYLPIENLVHLISYDIQTSLDLESATTMTGTVWRVTG
jgi:predicted nicotinamide N-methyase